MRPPDVGTVRELCGGFFSSAAPPRSRRLPRPATPQPPGVELVPDEQPPPVGAEPDGDGRRELAADRQRTAEQLAAEVAAVERQHLLAQLQLPQRDAPFHARTDQAAPVRREPHPRDPLL